VPLLELAVPPPAPCRAAFLQLRVFVGAALSVYILASEAAFVALMLCSLRPLMAHLARRAGLARHRHG